VLAERQQNLALAEILQYCILIINRGNNPLGAHLSEQPHYDFVISAVFRTRHAHTSVLAENLPTLQLQNFVRFSS
jgi:hypothetical protein